VYCWRASRPEAATYLSLYKMGWTLYSFFIPSLVQEAPNAIARAVLFPRRDHQTARRSRSRESVRSPTAISRRRGARRLWKYMTYGEAVNSYEMCAGRLPPKAWAGMPVEERIAKMQSLPTMLYCRGRWQIGCAQSNTQVRARPARGPADGHAGIRTSRQAAASAAVEDARLQSHAASEDGSFAQIPAFGPTIERTKSQKIANWRRKSERGSGGNATNPHARVLLASGSVQPQERTTKDELPICVPALTCPETHGAHPPC